MLERNGLIVADRGGRIVLYRDGAVGGLPLFLDECEARWLMVAGLPGILAERPLPPAPPEPARAPAGLA